MEILTGVHLFQYPAKWMEKYLIDTANCMTWLSLLLTAYGELMGSGEDIIVHACEPICL